MVEIPEPVIKKSPYELKEKRGMKWFLVAILLVTIFVIGFIGIGSFSSQVVEVGNKCSSDFQECQATSQNLIINIDKMAQKYAGVKCCTRSLYNMGLDYKFYYVSGSDVVCTNIGSASTKPTNCS